MAKTEKEHGNGVIDGVTAWTNSQLSRNVRHSVGSTYRVPSCL